MAGTEAFEAYFRHADSNQDGRISGQEAVAFFQGAGLPQQVLAQVWMHADQNKAGFLGRPEFFNMLRLVTVAQSGRQLTPNIVQCALYGPAAAKIPPPKIAAGPCPSLGPSSLESQHVLEIMATGTPGVRGTVYKGNLEGFGEIAVRRYEGNPPETLNKGVYYHKVRSIMQQHDHINIVKLLAFSHYDGPIRVREGGRVHTEEGVETLPCYEYFPNGSLYDNLFDETAKIDDWVTRFSVIKGICDGLKFLHTLQPAPIIHLNLKPQNIMLDHNMVPKIADFRYSRIVDPAQSRIHTQSSVGSVGYMAPEYLYKEVNEISARFDIYSLGLIIIEITTRQNNPGIDQKTTREFIREVAENCKDQARMVSEYPGVEEDHLQHQIDCIHIGLRCLNLNHNERPTIVKIVDELNALW